MISGPPDEYRKLWTGRSYYGSIALFLPIIQSCDAECVPNYKAKHIGVWHTRLRRSHNFIGFKGSEPRDFSIELKIDQDEREEAILRSHNEWIVDPWDDVAGYRVHLPAQLADRDVKYLKALVQRAFHEWRARRAPT